MMIDDLAKIIEHLTANRLFYLTNRWCPKTNEEGEPILFKVPFGEEMVWVMNPELLAYVHRIAAEAGMFLVEFDIESFIRRQAMRADFYRCW